MVNHKNKKRGAAKNARNRRARQNVNSSNGGTALRRPRGRGKQRTSAGQHLPSVRQLKANRIPQMGNAVMIRTPQIGIPNLKGFKTSYYAGTIYIGNGTLGATNKVYYLLNSGLDTVTGNSPIPIAPASSDLGASYITAIEQLFRRKHYKSLKIYFIALQSSTTNNMTLTVAPVRGPPDAIENYALASTTDTTANHFTQSALMSYNGVKTIDSFESMSMDLTPYIAGGSGSDQREFAIGAAANDGGAAANSELGDLLGIIPASIVVAGNSTVSSLQGTSTHAIVVEQCCDYLDFTGANAVQDPIGLHYNVIKTKQQKDLDRQIKEEKFGNNNLQSVLQKLEYLMAKDSQSNVIVESDDDQKFDLSVKLTESQLIDKTINKTIKRIKAEESKSTDTPQTTLNVSPGWFSRGPPSVNPVVKNN